jgi:hypothetical protein
MTKTTAFQSSDEPAFHLQASLPLHRRTIPPFHRWKAGLPPLQKKKDPRTGDTGGRVFATR